MFLMLSITYGFLEYILVSLVFSVGVKTYCLGRIIVPKQSCQINDVL